MFGWRDLEGKRGMDLEGNDFLYLDFGKEGFGRKEMEGLMSLILLITKRFGRKIAC